jgi:adenine-specific DNA-methyltransferase
LKTRAEVTPEKLRGGFYTPRPLVAHALRRLASLLPSVGGIRLLEPGVGAGAFLDGLQEAGFGDASITAIDIDATAVAATADKLANLHVAGRVFHQSALLWSLETTETFDGVIGNLPFVRFQFVPDADRKAALVHGTELGVPVAGVANLWLPMLLASLRLLRAGGAFSLVLPAECFTGISAGNARKWLLENTSDLQCDLYPPGSFPGVLQEVVLLSGRRTGLKSEAAQRLSVVLHHAQHSANGFDENIAVARSHLVPVNATSWTRLLLSPAHVAAIDEAMALPGVGRLSDVARFEVAAVTGANSFFSLRASEVDRRQLQPWARPLLARAKQAPGLRLTTEDLAQNVGADRLAFLFDAGMSPAIRSTHPGLDDYLAAGEAEQLHERYKCRIREPWYAIPHIKHGTLMLSKRCHRFPRAIVNETDAVTTDTIYRGRLLTSKITESDFVAAFHNSLTLLSAELEGRNFGGGVLELVPSEVSHLAVVAVAGMGEELPRLDAVCREASEGDAQMQSAEVLIRETDLLLAKTGKGINADLLGRLGEARLVLQRRRLDRCSNGID